MASTNQPHSIIKIPAHRKRKIAEALLKAHRDSYMKTGAIKALPTIRIVCISDTHNKQPTVPLGDVLIHAGDLTENGSFDEVQNGLSWLSSLPHKYKILIAGNHDVLFDDVFLANYPERRYGQTKTKQDLDWGSVIFLQDSLVTLEIPESKNIQQQQEETSKNGGYAANRVRKINIFGSPWTPQYGISAFQYHPNNSRHWEGIFASLDRKPDIIITHGPPHLHLDRRDFHRAGCTYLAEEIYRVNPYLHVFGHIHASYGQEYVQLDGVQRAYDDIISGQAGWGGVIRMCTMVLWARVKRVFGGENKHRMTAFVNAAVVGGPENMLQNDPVIIDL